MAQEVKEVVLDWEGGLRFQGGIEGGHQLLVDGEGAAAQSPMTMLLMALAGCTGADMAHILERMRVPLARCRIRLRGTRREQEPRRYVAMHLTFELSGEGLDEAKARRAAELSLEKYCSVAHSLAPDIALSHDVRVV